MNKKTDENFTVPDQTIKPVDIPQLERLIEAEKLMVFGSVAKLRNFMQENASSIVAEIKALHAQIDEGRLHVSSALSVLESGRKDLALDQLLKAQIVLTDRKERDNG